jgi:mono/diheme cytochrome c family protein
MRRLWSVVSMLALCSLVLSVGWAVADPDGKALYDSKCASCHGADGVAKEMWAKKGARNFNDPAWQKEKADEDLTKATTDGIPDKKMPAYKDKLKPEEITAVVKYIRTLGPK